MAWKIINNIKERLLTKNFKINKIQKIEMQHLHKKLMIKKNK